jgi:hypothetical protein
VRFDLGVLCFTFGYVAFLGLCPVRRKNGCTLDIFALSCLRFALAFSFRDLNRSVTLCTHALMVGIGLDSRSSIVDSNILWSVELIFCFWSYRSWTFGVRYNRERLVLSSFVMP